MTDEDEDEDRDPATPVPERPEDVDRPQSATMARLRALVAEVNRRASVRYPR
ncbi:hypothetical protein OG875_11945 [Streptomyces sp. NBC_01498]|uniref:hypothetical protein n=1 Tax=Streptomyces sp. NBC_01498 TaxID=2975870 RepID=UPI002E7B227D|nr:hypothetical protein [Streptomyces sp. NBC_01498]WTL25241.1 hypothetical protein OG875_11945 [Streptomyces sp. NBC_01498]